MDCEPTINIAATRSLESRMLTAAECGDASTIRKLLKKFVSPNVKDSMGVSALAKAAKGWFETSTVGPNVLTIQFLPPTGENPLQHALGCTLSLNYLRFVY